MSSTSRTSSGFQTITVVSTEAAARLEARVRLPGRFCLQLIGDLVSAASAETVGAILVVDDPSRFLVQETK